MTKNNYFNQILLFLIAFFGLITFSGELLYFNTIDGDLCANFIQGFSVFHRGQLIEKDIFAFTPVLDGIVDHEWGTGVIVFSLLKFFGPQALSVYKVLLGCGVLILIVLTGRMSGCRWTTLFLLILPCALTILPAYIPVVRSHALTYLFFSLTLFCLEKIRHGFRFPAYGIVIIMILWTNVHGGFVAGLGMVGIYLATDFVLHRKNTKILFFTLLASTGATLINPHGFQFWLYLLPAITMERVHIAEWQAMTPFAFDIFLGFTLLFVLTCFSLIFSWKKLLSRDNFTGLIIIGITCYLAFNHRRHAAFFAIAAGSYLGPYFESMLYKITLFAPKQIREKIHPLLIIFIIYSVLFVDAARFTLPHVSFDVTVPQKRYPLREVDILSFAKAKGNIVVPLEFGNYVKWRLHPSMKVSMDGRYEIAFKRDAMDMNFDFFKMKGKSWDRIIKKYPVDFIILSHKSTNLKEDDLKKLNFIQIYYSPNSSLYVRNNLAKEYQKIANQLTEQNFNVFDPRIPEGWWEN